MLRLNNKGYLLVEIVVAIVLGLTIAYFLMNLTIKFSKTEEDIYQSILWTNDKNIITNVIMEDILKYKVLDVEKSGNKEVIFTYEDEYGNEIEKELGVSSGNVRYGDYSKSINKSLTIEDIDFKEKEGQYIYIKIPFKSIYSTQDYGIKLFIPIESINE